MPNPDTVIETLSNGVRLVYEKLPHVRTAAMGIWVQSGSRHEPEALCGISHFLEHMVFKGTVNRNAREIAEQMDAIGGQMNAFTATECTCFYARALDSHFNVASDILCDIFFNAKFDPKDIRTERNVVYEEIGMYKDSPEDLSIDRLTEAVFNGSSLGRPILGTRKTLSGFNSDILHKYRDEYYTSEGIVVSVAGNFPDAELDKLRSRFGAIPQGKRPVTTPATYHKSLTLKKKDTEQNHLCFAFPMPGAGCDERYTIQLMSSVLGGGMSSRLFQKVREEAGLCYSISSFTNAASEQGLFCIHTALSKETESAAISLILQEIDKLCSCNISDAELFRVREQYKANLMMGMENTGARMNHLAQSVIRLGKTFTADEIIQKIDSVTPDDIRSCAQRILNREAMSFSAVGELKGRERYKRAFSDL